MGRKIRLRHGVARGSIKQWDIIRGEEPPDVSELVGLRLRLMESSGIEPPIDTGAE